MVQYGGLISAQFHTVSYVQCSPGSYNSGVNCPACSAGKFSNVPGASFCHLCNPGTFSAASATVCTDCAAGLLFVWLCFHVFDCLFVLLLISLPVVVVAFQVLSLEGWLVRAARRAQPARSRQLQAP